MLSERPIYHRANFSSQTTPESSGARRKDPWGHEYARIPLQLPGNLVDPTHRPKAVEMMLTKLNIPLQSIPITRIPFNSLTRWAHDEIVLETKGIVTLWPFMLRADGFEDGGYNGFAPDFDKSNWPTFHALFPVQGWLSLGNETDLRIREAQRTGYLNFFNIEDVMEYLSTALNESYNAIFSDHGIVNERFRFMEENSKLVIQVLHNGESTTRIPYCSLYWDVYATSAVNGNGPLLSYTTNSAGGVTNTANDSPLGFSIVVNKCVKDMLPRLPWRRVNNRGLREDDEIPNWEESNDGDPYFYVLDTNTADSHVTGETLIAAGNNTLRHVRTVEYTFDGCNLISVVPIQSFIVTLSGITTTLQTYPVNMTDATASAALTTVIPCIEVYYPAWTQISDLSTNIIISKDAFTNAAPFTLDSTALTQRDLQFIVYYVLNDGTMHELTIPPDANLSLQVCFSIFY